MTTTNSSTSVPNENLSRREDGSLFLGLNEGNLNDNKGSFDVKVEISPDGGE
jgi:hypothetical protein